MDGNPPPGPQASCRLARRANPTPLVDNHRKHHHRHPQKTLPRNMDARSSAPRRNSCSHGIADTGGGGARAIIMSATPPSVKTTPCSERARKQRDHPRNRRHHPQQAPQTLQQLPTMPTSADRSCTQSQDQADRASLPDRNRKLSSPATKPGRPLARPGYADQSRPAPQQRVSKSQNRSLERVDPRRDQDSDHITSTSMRSPWQAPKNPCSPPSTVVWPDLTSRSSSVCGLVPFLCGPSTTEGQLKDLPSPCFGACHGSRTPRSPCSPHQNGSQGVAFGQTDDLGTPVS